MAERARSDPPPIDAWIAAALPPLLEIPALNAATSAPRLGVAVETTTGARRDAYALGDLGADETAARLEAWTGAAPERVTLFVELAEAASRFDAAISRFGLARTMRTARGDLEFAEMGLRENATTRPCVGFRLAPSDAAGLRGILCSAKSGKLLEDRLACLVEGVALTPEGREGGLEAVIRGAPRQSGDGSC